MSKLTFTEEEGNSEQIAVFNEDNVVIGWMQRLNGDNNDWSVTHLNNFYNFIDMDSGLTLSECKKKFEVIYGGRK